MKIFSQAKDERTDKYASSEKIKNQIDRLIDEHLVIKANDQIISDPKLTIEGKEELISKLENLINIEKIKKQIAILEGEELSKKTLESELKKISTKINSINKIDQVAACKASLNTLLKNYVKTNMVTEVNQRVNELTEQLSQIEANFKK